MPIDIQYTPVGGVAELARRGGQQQQAVREQGFQFQQDLIGLQANLQQKRDVMLEGFQQQATLQAQQYETVQQERKYQWLNYQTRQDRKFQEEMAELQIEQYKDRQKFDVKLENEQYVAKRKFDFEQELQGLAVENQFEMQIKQQEIMGDLAEQQMKTQQKQREFEAAEKAIEEDQWTDRREKDAMLLQLRTKIKAPKTITYSPEALRIAGTTGQDPSHVEWALQTEKQLPAELRMPFWAAYNNPNEVPRFNELYQAWYDSETQKLAGEYGLIPRQETPSQRRGRGVPKWRSGDAGLTKQWDYEMTPKQQDTELTQIKAYEGQMAGIEALGKQAVTGAAEEAERQEHLKMALESKNRATRNYHLKEAGINPSDLDIANRLIKEHDKAWGRYNSAYKEWVREEFDINEPRKGQEDRESRLRTRFTEAATDMNRIEAQLKQLSEQFQGKTIRVISPEGIRGELPISEWEEYKKRGFRKE